MPTTISFSGLFLELPDRWFEAKTRGADIRTFLRFTDSTITADEPIDFTDPLRYPRGSFTSLTFTFAMGMKPRNFKRRLTAYRKWQLENGQITPSEQRHVGGRDWTCWEVTIPPLRYAPVEFMSCDGYTLVGKSEEPEHVLWHVMTMGPSSLAEKLRESRSFALSNVSFSSH